MDRCNLCYWYNNRYLKLAVTVLISDCFIMKKFYIEFSDDTCGIFDGKVSRN